MQQNNQNLEKFKETLRFILTEANAQELGGIFQATQDRLKELGLSAGPQAGQNPQMPQMPPAAQSGQGLPGISSAKKALGLNPGIAGYREQAESLASQVNGMFTEEMTQNVAHNAVRQMLHNYLPPIPPEHIEVLVKEFTTSRPQKVDPQLFNFMVASFLDFSTGVMHADIKTLLDMRLENWHEKFWANFPASLQTDVRQVLLKKMSGKEVFQKLAQGAYE